MSYDLPFIWRSDLNTSGIVLVYIDENSARELHQPLDRAWDRRLHAKLLDRLTRDCADSVFYDIVFAEKSADPGADQEFSAALRRNGKAVLGASLEDTNQLGTFSETIIMPCSELRKAAAGCGLLALRPIDPDYGVRKIFDGNDQIPASTQLLAELHGARARNYKAAPGSDRWINYYGPSDTFQSVSFSQALSESGVPPGFFRNKIVLIGGRPSTSYLNLGKDEFATPYSRWGKRFMTGMEVHANCLANLLRQDWLKRSAPALEITVILIVGFIAGIGLRSLRPDYAVLAAIILGACLIIVACQLQWHSRLWLAWMVPVAVQIPTSLACSVGWQYFVERRRRSALRKAFSFYLSPLMAERITNSNFDLSPGGKLVDASVMFTDLKGFTTISESLGDPEAVSKVLIEYFNNTTQCILKSNGTIIKYIGDAVMAAWGAPLEDPDHACRAALAAYELNQASKIEVSGHKLITRIGVNTGSLLAGNLGSDFRFDYTLIGDTVNFASRLEGINKHLGTEILLGDTTAQAVVGRFLTRKLGKFQVVGKTHPVIIHELIHPMEPGDPIPEWSTNFEQALVAITNQQFDEAVRFLEKTSQTRPSGDGPANFYLKEIAERVQTKTIVGWDGVIKLSDK